jgi:CheY-like chemotaxis protein
MVVEDNDFVRMQIASFLKNDGMEVVECENGAEAIDLLDEQINVIIADIRMEPIDGFEFIKNIRGREFKTPVILVTGDHNPDLLNESGRWGVFAVLMKPVEKDRLVKTVQRAIKVGQVS